MYEPTFERFQELSQQGNMIPVYRVIMADLDTPVSAFIKLAEDDHPHAFLLESVEQGEKLGRYSFIGVNPSHIFICRGNTLIQINGEKRIEHQLNKDKDPLTVLQQFMSRYKAVEVEGLPPFFGGLVGYLGYEMTQHFERLEFNNRDDFNVPDAVFYFADTLVIFDHFQRTMMVAANVLLNSSPEETYYDAVRRIDRVVKKLQSPLSRISFGAGLTTHSPVKTNWNKNAFLKAVEQSKEYIKAGDIYQVQVGIRSDVEITSGPLDLYRALRRINPSPYTFFFRHENLCLVGGSPEILVKMTNNQVTYRPIAGTRRRGRTEEEDHFLERELLNDAKEQAEHIMLVDLGRNDIGRVCNFHTVKVTDLMYVERYSHVMHLVSNVEGELRDDNDAYDLMRATFPAGTVTGSPKIRSMEIIEELEETRRGPYAGAVGWFGLTGGLDFCITLRTIVVIGTRAYIQASAGIVADSQPELEYKEVMNKSCAMLRAVEMAECTKD
ncbi:MAG: anthranilate synthase component I [Candidatus Omnitrophota bacterium]|jgi:anthranilate synthase component 1|nr:MAG: anthranilate synthase component I [Candidatus Omnitrophota bacterium]